MSLLRFTILFAVFTFGLGLLAYGIEAYNPGDIVLIPKFWVIFGAIAILTFMVYVMAWYGIRKGGEMSIYGIMGSIFIKMLFCMVLVLVYLLKFKVGKIQFAANFISLYFLFTAFEVYCLLRNLRHQNKT